MSCGVCYGRSALGPLRLLRSSRCALRQPDAFGTGESCRGHGWDEVGAAVPRHSLMPSIPLIAESITTKALKPLNLLILQTFKHSNFKKKRGEIS